MDKNKRDLVVNHFEENKRGEPLSPDIFNDICHDIEDTMKREMYPNFLTYQAEKLQNRYVDFSFNSLFSRVEILIVILTGTRRAVAVITIARSIFSNNAEVRTARRNRPVG